MEVITIVRHLNAYQHELDRIEAVTMHEVRKAVGRILDILGDGDSITFEVVEK